MSPSTATITSTDFKDMEFGGKARSQYVDDNFNIFRGHLIPVDPNTSASIANTYDLGSSEYPWRNVYLKNLPVVNGATMGSVSGITGVLEESATAGEIVSAFGDSDGLNFVRKRLTDIALVKQFSAVTIGASAEAGAADRISFAAIDDKTFVMAFTEYSATVAYAKAMVGQLEGIDITLGAAVLLNQTSSGQAHCPRVCKIGTNKVALAYIGIATAAAYAIVGTVTSLTLGLGAQVQLDGGPSAGFPFANASIAPLTTDRFVCSYRRASATYQGIIAATVNGSVITLGSVFTATTFSPANSLGSHLFQSKTNEFVLFSFDGGSPPRPVALAGTVSALTVTIGTSYSIGSFIDEAGNTNRYFDVAQVSKNEFFLMGGNSGTSKYVTSGLKLSSGIFIEEFNYEKGPTPNFGITASAGRLAIAGCGNGRVCGLFKSHLDRGIFMLAESKIGQLYPITSPYFISTATIGGQAMGVGIVGPHFILAYMDRADSDRGKLLAGVHARALGVLNATGSPGSTVTVSRIAMVSANHSGLTLGGEYFIQPDASVGLDPVGEYIGIAISSTELLVGG